MRPTSENYFAFGDFRLDGDEKLLWKGEVLADLTPKAFDVLSILVRNAGKLVTKEEIFQEVWGDNFVEETNLTHHIFRLRKVLGETDERKFIETVPRRGYRFVATLEKISLESEPTTRDGSSLGKKGIVMAAGAIALIAVFGWFAYNRSSTSQLAAESLPAPEPRWVSRITNGGKFVAATISPDGKFAAYAQNYTSGEGMLYIRQIETNHERRLLKTAERNFGSVSFSPDGTFVYYIAYEKDDPKGSLYRVPVIGGPSSKILEGVRLMFSLSPDGKSAAFYRFDNSAGKVDIVNAAIDGSGEEKTVASFDRGATAVSSVPAFSPDGKFVSFSYALRDADFSQPQFAMHVVELESGEIKRISEEKWIEIGKTVWLPDGKGLIFPGNRPRKGTQIYSLSYPEGELKQVTDELNYYGNYGMGITRDGSTIVADLWGVEAQLWSMDTDSSASRTEQLTNGTSDGAVGLASLPEGRITYSTRNGEDSDIWLLQERDGLREGIPLTSDPSTEGGMCVPRDGTVIVFSSDRTGGSHLFRMNIDGSELKALTSGNERESSPDCVADGSTVLFESGSKIWKVPIGGGDPVRLTEFDCVAPSASPDGNFFSCIQPVGVQLQNTSLKIVPIDGGDAIKSFDVIPFAWYHRPARWTPDGSAIVFKKTENQIGNLWRQDLKGGDPVKITDFRSETIFNHVYSYDGKQIILSRGKVAFDTVMIRNF
jgi:Tol biopolymer transport system component/DNA-binding winged helix-turn-helix (wHTH) protein